MVECACFSPEGRVSGDGWMPGRIGRATSISVWMGILAAIVVLGCAPGGPGGSAERAAEGRSQPKRMAIGAVGNIYTVSSLMNTGSTGANQPGIGPVATMLHSGLTVLDAKQVRVPELAEDVVSVENGSWKLLPGGAMETTWRLRPGVAWHDGTPLTTDDLLFGTMIGQDRELDIGLDAAYQYISGIRATDPRTIVVTWNQPYINADAFFTGAHILPRHLLEQHYQRDKRAFTELPYWSSEWVGTGPFRMRDFVAGSHLVMVANDGYALGRPNIDEVEVKFISDSTTILANLLSGSIQLVVGGGRAISVEVAQQIAQQWTAGRVQIDTEAAGGPVHLTPQHINPRPAIVANREFKAALLHAIDREEMAHELQAGLVPVAHSPIPVGDANYAPIENRVVKYDFDPRRAATMIEQLGYSRGADGRFRDAAGAPLTLEITSTETDIYVKSALASLDYWKRIGIEGEFVQIPRARTTDLEYRASYPGFTSTTAGYLDPPSYHSNELRTAANQYRGRNISGFSSPELDGIIDRYLTTIPLTERIRAFGDFVAIVTRENARMPLMVQGAGFPIHNCLVNVTPGGVTRDARTWDLKPGCL